MTGTRPHLNFAVVRLSKFCEFSKKASGGDQRIIAVIGKIQAALVYCTPKLKKHIPTSIMMYIELGSSRTGIQPVHTFSSFMKQKSAVGREQRLPWLLLAAKFSIYHQSKHLTKRYGKIGLGISAS